MNFRPHLRYHVEKRQRMNQKEFESIAKSARQVALDVCHRFGLDDDLSEDVAQDTMLKLWTLHQELPADKPVEGLAAVVSRHLVISLLRQRRATVPIETQRLLVDKYVQPDARAEIADNEAWLERRMSTLPSTEYQVLHLRQVDGKTNEEIARILGVNKNSVATLLSRARKRLLNDIKRRMNQ